MAAFAMNRDDPLIALDGLGKRYAGRSVIENVTLRLWPGEIVGLVGANGGGKTTTLRMIAGLLRPDHGSGTVFGEDICSSRRDGRARIGYMGQGLALYPDLTVLENLRFRASVYGIADPGARIAALTKDYAIADVLNHRFETLSGGWARRVQFAATIIHAPPLLLLDEPTANGHAIILATHDLIEAERLPKIILYHQGHASAAMTPAALIAQSGTKSLEDAIIRFATEVPT
jgi:ABC-2 type transport system ATP-binding protein